MQCVPNSASIDTDIYIDEIYIYIYMYMIIIYIQGNRNSVHRVVLGWMTGI
jgi:hypothetical protein